MPVLVFLLIGAVWAAFLLPSFFENRRRAPISATRNFQRSNELLASVAVTDAQELMARRRQSLRRRRLLMFLSLGAAATLGGALLTGSVVWLGATLIFDLLIGAYITLLLLARQRAYAARAVPRIGPAVSAAEPEATRREANPPATVRVVAG